MKQVIYRLSTQSALALTILRVVMGLILALAGYGKVFGGGFAVTFFHRLGIPLAHLLGPLVSFLELFGGLALAVGLFTRYLGVLFTLEFIVATYFMYLARGIMGARLDLMLVVGALMLATSGGGLLSLDRNRRWDV